MIKTLLASIRQDERDERAAVCSSGQSQVSRIDWRPQSRSRGRWLRPPRARASARSPSEAAAREPSSSSSSCSGVDGGRRKERLLSGSDQWRKNQLENQQIKKNKSVRNENKNEKKLNCSIILRKIQYITFLPHVEQLYRLFVFQITYEKFKKIRCVVPD